MPRYEQILTSWDGNPVTTVAPPLKSMTFKSKEQCALPIRKALSDSALCYCFSKYHWRLSFTSLKLVMLLWQRLVDRTQSMSLTLRLKSCVPWGGFRHVKTTDGTSISGSVNLFRAPRMSKLTLQLSHFSLMFCSSEIAATSSVQPSHPQHAFTMLEVFSLSLSWNGECNAHAISRQGSLCTKDVKSVKSIYDHSKMCSVHCSWMETTWMRRKIGLRLARARLKILATYQEPYLHCRTIKQHPRLRPFQRVNAFWAHLVRGSLKITVLCSNSKIGFELRLSCTRADTNCQVNGLLLALSRRFWPSEN